MHCWGVMGHHQFRERAGASRTQLGDSRKPQPCKLQGPDPQTDKGRELQDPPMVSRSGVCPVEPYRWRLYKNTHKALPPPLHKSLNLVKDSERGMGGGGRQHEQG